MSSTDASLQEQDLSAEEDLLAHLPSHSPSGMSNEALLSHIERVVSAEAVPPCRVCGGKLMVVAVGGYKSTVWACPNAQQPTDGHLTWKVRQRLRDHYNISQWVQYREETSYIRELVERFRKLQAAYPVNTPDTAAASA